MRRIGKLGFCGALLFSGVLWSAGVSHAEAKTAATIVSPHANSIVGRVTEVVYETTQPGVPLVLVAAEQENAEWWVQDRVQRDATGEFTASVRFGNEKTTAGSEFHLIALTPRSTSEAAAFKVGESIKDLPADAIVSSPMTFVLKSDELTGAE